MNLDAATGKLRWYYQGVPDDFKDWDMQASPISARTGGVSVVIGSGKMGDVYEMNASTGKLIWKTPVGAHNGHDDDSLLALEHRSTLKAPFTILPGPLGGVLTDLAVAGRSVYVATLDLPLTFTSLKTAAPTKGAGSPTGEVEALSLATGKVEWDRKLPQLPLGGVTVSNDLLFTTLYDGELIALNRTTGAIVYSPPAADVRQLADRHRRQCRDRSGGRPHHEPRTRTPADRRLHGAVGCHGAGFTFFEGTSSLALRSCRDAVSDVPTRQGEPVELDYTIRATGGRLAHPRRRFRIRIVLAALGAVVVAAIAGGIALASTRPPKIGSGVVVIDTNLAYQGARAAGTGMVLTSSGEVLTNNHVIRGATAIRVVVPSTGRSFTAKVVGYDTTDDVAVLQASGASNLKTIPLGDSDTVTAGQSVQALGNAGGTGALRPASGTVTGIDRGITVSDEQGGSESLAGMIETNAGIQPGDSGGPLMNADGQVIGMDTAASVGNGSEQAATTAGFAIPINKATSIAQQIVHGDASATIHIGDTAFLGVAVEADSYGYPGAAVTSVVPNSPAAAAGLAPGDVITSLGGQSVSSPDGLTTLVASQAPGRPPPPPMSTSTARRRQRTSRWQAGRRASVRGSRTGRTVCRVYDHPQLAWNRVGGRCRELPHRPVATTAAGWAYARGGRRTRRGCGCGDHVSAGRSASWHVDRPRDRRRRELERRGRRPRHPHLDRAR